LLAHGGRGAAPIGCVRARRGMPWFRLPEPVVIGRFAFDNVVYDADADVPR